MSGPDQDLNGAVFKITMETVRRHPDIRKWAARPGEDTGHDFTVRAWKSEPAIQAALHRVKYVRRDEYLTGLLEAAEAALEAEQEKLDHIWAHATSHPEWGTFPQSSRDLFLAVIAKAGERDEYGGLSVLMSHQTAIAIIEAMTGTRYSSRTITQARKPLIEAGVLTAEAGQAWAPGKRGRPTVYGVGTYCGSPHCNRYLGSGHQFPVPDTGNQNERSESLAVPRPRLSLQARDAMLASFSRSALIRAIEDAAGPQPGPAASFDEVVTVPAPPLPLEGALPFSALLGLSSLDSVPSAGVPTAALEASHDDPGVQPVPALGVLPEVLPAVPGPVPAAWLGAAAGSG
jgi:hypothetical protein